MVGGCIVALRFFFVMEGWVALFVLCGFGFYSVVVGSFEIDCVESSFLLAAMVCEGPHDFTTYISI